MTLANRILELFVHERKNHDKSPFRPPLKATTVGHQFGDKSTLIDKNAFLEVSYLYGMTFGVKQRLPLSLLYTSFTALCLNGNTYFNGSHIENN